MRLRRHALEPGALVDAARIDEHAARPQADPAVAGGARETDAFVDQSRPDAEPARLRVDEEQTQLGDLVRTLLEEDTTDRLAVDVGDPAARTRRIMGLDVLADDLRAPPSEGRAPSVFVGNARAAAPHHPAA